MSPFNIFGLQMALSLVLYSMLAKRYVWPKLLTLPLGGALTILSFTQAFRYIGMSFLVPGVVGPLLPHPWVDEVAYGDLLTAILAIITATALIRGSRAGIGLLWLTNIVGLVDLLTILGQGVAINLAEQNVITLNLNAAWYIPTFVGPALLVFHFIIFATLIKRGGESLG